MKRLTVFLVVLVTAFFIATATARAIRWRGYEPQTVIKVSGVGGDYTTIQAALTANATENIVIQVYPGTYTDDTITFTADNQTIRGMGLTANQIVTTADAAIVDYGAYANCRIENIKITMTNPTTDKVMITGTGFLKLRWCHLGLAASNVNASEARIFGGTGDVTMTFGTIDYDNDSDDGTAYKAPILLESGSSYCFRKVIIDIDGTNASAVTTTFFGAGTGVFDLYRCVMDVVDTGATLTVGFGYLTGEGTSETYGNTIHVTGAATETAYGGYLASGTSMVFRSMYNHIHVLAAGGTANSWVIGANCTVVSQFDDIIAADGASVTGTYTYLNSPSDGQLGTSSTTVVTNLNADLLDGESATAFQDANANLTTYAGIAPTADVQTFLANAADFEIDADGNITGKSWTSAKQNGVPGYSGVYGAEGAETWQTFWEGAANLANHVYLKHPNTGPQAANQIMLFPTEDGNHRSTYAWMTAFGWKAISVDPSAFVCDGTNCTDPEKTQINGGPTTWMVCCADAAGVFEFKIPQMPDNWDGGDIHIMLDVYSAEGTPAGTISFLVELQARGHGVIIDNTWVTLNGAIYFEDAETAGTTVDIQYGLFQSENITAMAAAGAGRDVLFVRNTRDYDDATHDTSTQEIRILGATVFYKIDELEERD